MENSGPKPSLMGAGPPLSSPTENGVIAGPAGDGAGPKFAERSWNGDERRGSLVCSTFSLSDRTAEDRGTVGTVLLVRSSAPWDLFRRGGAVGPAVLETVVFETDESACTQVATGLVSHPTSLSQETVGPISLQGCQWLKPRIPLAILRRGRPS